MQGVVRLKVGLLMAFTAVLLLAPMSGSASAQSGPAPTVPRATTTIATTAPPTTSTASTPPTTRNPTATTRPRVTGTTALSATTAPTNPAPTTATSTTVASIPAAAPAPVTLPLASASQSGNISAVFPILSGMGFAILVALLSAQWLLTKPGRQGPTL